MNVALIQLNLKFIDYYMTQIIYDTYRVTHVSINMYCCVISITKITKIFDEIFLSIALLFKFKSNILIFFFFSMLQS